MNDREREQLQLAAAWSRVVLGLFAMFGLPLLYPGLAQHRGLLGVYVGVALAQQVLIWKGIGGATRAVVGGLIDIAVLTFLVHRVGSVATMLVSIYFFASILNTLVVGRRVGVTLAALAAAVYAGVVAAEQTGWLPYAPDGPPWAQLPPGLTEAATAASLLSILLVASAAVVGLLVQRIRTREAELVDANAQLETLSQRDPLTQLYNRRHLMARLEEELARVRRGHALAVVMIDLDGFKRVNDERGHQTGDEVLRSIADALGGATRAVDVPGRYGGDEFVVLLPDTAPRQARVVAERLVAAAREAGEGFDAERPITASVGVAHARPDDGARALVQRADVEAYRAKAAGGDGLRMEGAASHPDGARGERPSDPARA